MLKNFRFKNVDTSINRVAQGLIDTGLFLKRGNPTFVISHDNAVAAHLIFGNALGDLAGDVSFLSVPLQGRSEIEIDQRITTEHNKGVVKNVLEILDFFQATG